MATDKTYPSGLRRIGSGAAESAHGTYGFATPDSIETAVQSAIGKGVDALDTLTNLKVNATPLPSTSGPTATITGVVPTRTITIGIPEGKPGLDGGGALDASLNRRALLPLLTAVDAGTARIVWMGDSKSEGFFMPNTAARAMDRVRDSFRARWSSTTDVGRGYLPACYATMNTLPEEPTRSGDTFESVNLGGLGMRSVWMNSAGSGSVTWPSLTWSAAVPVRVVYMQRPGHADLEILVDGAVVKTVATAGADDVKTVDVSVTAGAHVISVRAKGGVAQVAGIEHRTSTSGIAVYDASLSGSTVSTFTSGTAATLHWKEVERIAPHLIVAAFGANDMAKAAYGRTPVQWASDLTQLVVLRDRYAPNAGLLLLHSAQDVGDVGSSRLQEYEAQARAALGGAPRASVLYESSLWQPRPDHTYSLNTTDPDGWLTDAVHITPSAASRIADLIVATTAAGMPAASGGVSVTASQIADATTLGRDVLRSPDAASVRDAIGAAVSSHSHPAAAVSDSTAVGRAVLTATDAASARDAIGAAAQRDTGWRDITSAGVLRSGWTATSISIRRIADRVTLRVTGLSSSAATGDTWLAMPTGFRLISGTAVMVSGVSMVPIRSDSVGALASPRPVSAETRACEVSWICDQTFPTTLPGTPA